MRFAPLSAVLEDSITLALDAQARRLAAEGVDVVNMTAGQPDCPAPAVVQAAAVAKVRSGDVRYTPAAGTPGLRAAIAEHLSATRGCAFAPQDVAVCHSAKHALTSALSLMAGPGDEVLIPLPAWASYFAMVKIAGASAVGVPPAAGCRPDLPAIAAAITPRTRAILINTPSNPTGVVLTAEEMRGLVDLAEQHDLWILSDEIYRRLVYDGGQAVGPVDVSASARERTAIVDGASKVFAMTGYRIGYLAGPRELVDNVAKLNSQTTGSPNAVSQDAYEAGLREDPPEPAAMLASLVPRRALVCDGLRRLELDFPAPAGAFYVFADVARYLDERGSVGFCQDLLEAEKVALVPGSAFGVDSHVRLSYPIEDERISEALERLGRFLATRG